MGAKCFIYKPVTEGSVYNCGSNCANATLKLRKRKAPYLLSRKNFPIHPGFPLPGSLVTEQGHLSLAPGLSGWPTLQEAGFEVARLSTRPCLPRTLCVPPETLWQHLQLQPISVGPCGHNCWNADCFQAGKVALKLDIGLCVSDAQG